MANGSLIVRVTSLEGSIPIENALVTIYNATDGSEVIATRYTNNDGRTDVISLTAPPRSLSEKPDNGGIRPYAVYNVEVRHEGYYDVFNLEVPIFDGIQSILPINLLALPQSGADGIEPESGVVVENKEPDLTGGVQD